MKNKFYLMGLIGLTLATSNIALAQSFMNADGTVDWKKVDNLTAHDRWMEVAYKDTLSDGKKIAQDEAMSAVSKALAAQKAYDEGVANFTKKKEEGLSVKEKYELGMMTDEELVDYASINAAMAGAKINNGVDSIQELVDSLKNNPMIADLSEKDIERLEKYYDKNVVGDMLKDENHPFYADNQKLVDGYNEKYGSEEDRQQAEQDFWTEAEKNIRQDQNVYDANRNLENTLTPEMKNTLMGAMGVASSSEINTALNDPAKKQELQARLDSLSTHYSFPKIDLNTTEGQETLHNMVGTTSAGKMSTVEYRSDGAAIIQTTQERNDAVAKKTAEDLNNMFNNQSVINGIDITGGSYNIYTGEYNTPSWARGIGTGSGDANTGTGTGDGVSTGGLGASTTE